MKQRIRVNEVGPGMFSTERFVMFEINEKTYSLFVDASSLNGYYLEVDVLAQDKDKAFIELPREAINEGMRLQIPIALLSAQCANR